MEDQKSPTLVSQLPKKWQPQYVLKRIGEENIVISQETRDTILQLLANNGRFIQIGDHTVMLNTIKAIDPKWKNNIPPCPQPHTETTYEDDIAIVRTLNLQEIEEWKKYFGRK